jgi:hypothetical protein
VARRCERPGCGETASVSYGFDAERGTVWLAALTPNGGPTGGVLCRRHAEAMVLPNGWWLEDRRSDATLFTAATPAPTAHTYRPKRTRRRPTEPPPLPLDAAPTVTATATATAPPVPSWTPAFDAADDLGGLLDAKTPLLSRAFGHPATPSPER